MEVHFPRNVIGQYEEEINNIGIDCVAEERILYIYLHDQDYKTNKKTLLGVFQKAFEEKSG